MWTEPNDFPMGMEPWYIRIPRLLRASWERKRQAAIEMMAARMDEGY